MSNEKTAAAPEQAAYPLEVRVRPQAPEKGVYGFADIVIGGEDGLRFSGFPIKLNREGVLYTDMMGGYDKNGKYGELCKPTSPAGYKFLNEAVLNQYTQEIENTRAMLEAATAQMEGAAKQQAAPEQQGPAQEQAAPAAERLTDKQPAQADRQQAPAKRQADEQAKGGASLSDKLKEKATQSKAAPPPAQKPTVRGAGEIGA